MILATLVLLIGIILWRTYRDRRYANLFKSIPGPKGYPLVGNILEFATIPRNKRMETFGKYFNTYGRIFLLYTESVVVVHSASADWAQIVEKKMMERQEYNVKEDSNHRTEQKKSLIEILLDLSDPVTGSFSMSEINEQVDTFLFAGQDTVATSLSWTLLLVGQHPEVQKKIFEELNDVFGSSNHLPENEDLVQLKYLECVYKESLRLYPPIAFINRQITEDVVVGDYFIPAGVDLALHIHELHRSPEHFPNPDKFDPSNFFLENAQKRHPYAFVPFSAGPRNCIGQKFAMTEAKIILVQIFRHFEVESAHGIRENKEILDVMLVPGGGAKIKIRKRLCSA